MFIRKQTDGPNAGGNIKAIVAFIYIGLCW